MTFDVDWAVKRINIYLSIDRFDDLDLDRDFETRLKGSSYNYILLADFPGFVLANVMSSNRQLVLQGARTELWNRRIDLLLWTPAALPA